jgi:hypothetical protein
LCPFFSKNSFIEEIGGALEMSGGDAVVAGAEEEFTRAYASIQTTSITTAPDRRVFVGRHFVFFSLSPPSC